VNINPKPLRGFLIVPVLVIFFSCATFRLSGSELDDPVVFANIASVRQEWLSFADGVDYLFGRITNPQIEFWALRINLSNPSVSIITRAGIINENRILNQKVSSFVRENNLTVGINAVPFDVVTSREGQPIRNLGLVISRGEVITPINRSLDAIVFYKDGRTAIVRQTSITDFDEIENAIGGFYQILANGEPVPSRAAGRERHPRSAAGISSDGNYLYLLAIDGRRSQSIGSTEGETAIILRALGSWDGINFDGGGSTALVLRYPDGRVRTANIPVHGGIPGIERAVAGCIGIYVSPSTER
jgi:hypothetical protein